jgi:GntR family carbon starvation induced transcriptional regulator
MSILENRPPARAINRDTLTVQIEEMIRLDIVMGLLRPGERLRTQELERRYGVSATPLREAIQRLAAGGLVDQEPGFGARVTPMSVEDLHDVYAARMVVEGAAVELSVREGAADWETSVRDGMAWLRRASIKLRADASRENVREWSDAHRTFHFALLDECRSKWLIRFVKTLYEISERYRMLTAWGSQVPRDALSEHERICELALARDVEGTVAALRAHLKVTVDILDPALAERIPKSTD